MSQGKCTIADCKTVGRVKRGMCNKHYLRWLSKGDPNSVDVILGDDRLRIMSKIEKTPNGCWLWMGWVDKDGYGKTSFRGRNNCRAHRVVYELITGSEPPSQLLDHSCNIASCVNPSHLRVATPSQNAANRRKPRNTRERFKGIWKTAPNRWRACIGLKGSRRYLGTFDSDIEAARAYDSAATELYGEFARLNLQVLDQS